jgi:carboxyl-terminal processing protease
MTPRPAATSRTAARIVGTLVVLLIGVWLGGHPGWVPSPLRGALVDNSDGRLLHEALDVLSRDYYRRVDRSLLVNRGIAAAVASLNDPYSRYYNPAQYRTFLHESNPHLGGIGVDVVSARGGLRIDDVFPGSPAARAGLVRGDVITDVGSTSLARKSLDASSRLIKGEPGTRVTLTVVSGARKRTVTITRANVAVPVVTADLVVFHGLKLGDLQLSAFTDGAGTELRTQVDRMLHSGARGLILDLRSNGGGLLEEAVNVASIFIPDGTIVSTAGRTQPRQVYVAKGGAISTRIPVVVLVDHGTASAAEIVTGAIKDRGRGKVVGNRTYGKGVFQEIQTLSNGGALDITVGEYFTPSGRNLGGGGVREGSGIPPDIYAVSSQRSPGDRPLAVAERTVAAAVRAARITGGSR